MISINNDLNIPRRVNQTTQVSDCTHIFFGHSSFHAINAIVDEAADATADRVAVNATIVNEAAHAMAGRVSGISDVAGGLVGA